MFLFGVTPMPLRYDFDILDLSGRTGAVDAGLSAFLRRAGLAGDETAHRVALFRDTATAEALHHAPEALRDWMLAAGFGLTTQDSGLPSDRYRSEDEDLRIEIIARLAHTAADFPLPADPEDEGQFRLADFLQYLERARPMPLALGEGVAQPRPVGLRLPMIGQRLLRGLPRLAQLRRA